MWRIIKARIKQGYRTLKYPNQEPVFPGRFRGKPIVKDGLEIDLGQCLFDAQSPFAYSQDYRMAVSKRKDLILKGKATPAGRQELDRKSTRLNSSH